MFHSPAKYLPTTGLGLKLHQGVSWKAVEEWPGMDSRFYVVDTWDVMVTACGAQAELLVVCLGSGIL